MQKRLKFKGQEMSVKFLDMRLDDEFPISYFKYVQKHNDANKLHFHQAFEIGICLKNEGLFFVNDKVLSFKQHDVSFIFPNQPHIAQSPNEIPSEWIFITVDLDRIFSHDNLLLAELNLSSLQLPSIISNDRDFFGIVKIILNELDKKEENYQFLVKNQLLSLIIKLLRFKTKEINKSVLSGAYASVAPALSHISKFYYEEIPVTKMAHACYLSTSHFRVVFKEATGLTPSQYLENVRMRMAKTLLSSTKLSILSIAENTGYNSISSFNRTFKTHFEITPSAYRMKNQS